MPDDVISLSDSASERGSVTPDLHMTFDNFERDLPPVNFYYEHPENSPDKNLEKSPQRSLDKSLDKSSLSSSLQSRESSPEKAPANTSETSEKDTNDSPERYSKRPLKKITDKEKRAAEVGRRKQEVQEKRQQKDQERQLKQVEKLNKQCQDKDELLRNCRAIVDEGLRDIGYIEAIAEEMHDKKCVFSVARNPVPFSIRWQRTSVLYFLEEGEIQKSQEVVNEDQMLIVWDQKNVVDMIQNGSFKKSVKILQNSYKERLTLLIVASRKNGDKNVLEFCKTEMEEQLVEIQVLYNCTTLVVEGVKEMASTVCQFTKGIATIPLKTDRWQKLENVETYVTGEKRKLVAVNKEGYGLKQLWQKQLCQFNLCSWEMAEVISINYPSPSQLMKAYEECSDHEGEMLLADLQVRRAAGPMSCARKIGPELSKKIYTMFTCTDGDQFLDNISD